MILVNHFHGGDHDVGEGGSLAAKDAVGAKGDLGGNADHRAVGTDDTRHMGTVTLAIIGVVIGGRNGIVRRRGRVSVEIVAYQVIAIGHTAAITKAAAEIRMVIVDAGVHHRHLDPGAGVAQFGLGDISTGHLNSGVEIGVCSDCSRYRYFDNRIERLDARDTGQLA